ncbi:MAG: bifunctional metallophosphatase/5'-nucleotidase [Rhodospirillaceae bacterium]|nr:bifunctional metallophosphatase/5'-nucleotidase [Rhodospirillaceae bacterium]
MRHRLRFTALAAALLAAVAFAAGAAAQGKPVSARLTFLHFNDAYQISPRRGLGGMGPIATLIKRERAAAPSAVLTFGGDLISPSLLSGITKGRHMIEIANMLGMQVAVLGNHEFDFGADVMKERVAESKFPWLAANVLGADGRPFGGTIATKLLTMNGVKVGFVGLVTPEAQLYIRGGAPVNFAPFLPAARLAVAQLKQEGAQILVALTHMNLAEDRQLVREVRGLNLVLGGHEHIPITLYERGVLILKAGSDAEFLGVVQLDVTIENGSVSAIPSWRLVANYRIPADHTVQQVVRRYEQRLDKEMGQAIGKTETEMDSRAEFVRFRETAIGNLVADAIRSATNADVALVNGGGLRGNKRYPPGSTITARDIFTEMPFGNVVLVLEAKGSDLLAMLEHGLSQYGQEFGGFPQISGMKVVFDPAKPAGSRIVSAMIGGAPLDPGRSYRLALNDFLAGGGDGYAMLRDLKRVLDANAGPLMAAVVIDYIKRHGTVAAKTEGRLVAR